MRTRVGICEKCGEALDIGRWPFCPHQAVGSAAVIGDEYPGGKTFEHLDHRPVTVYSKTELHREMDKRHVRFTDRYHPNDGPDWRQAIDAQTLANATALVSRGARGSAEEEDPARLETLDTWIRDLGPR